MEASNELATSQNITTILPWRTEVFFHKWHVCCETEMEEVTAAAMDKHKIGEYIKSNFWDPVLSGQGNPG